MDNFASYAGKIEYEIELNYGKKSLIVNRECNSTRKSNWNK